MKAMILAAGRGKRLQPLTHETPKPILMVNQFSLIEHLLFRLSQSGFHEIVINVAYLAEKIIAHLKDGQQYNLNIVYSHESISGALETGGGIFNALHKLGRAPFLVISADIWTDYPFAQLKNKPLDGLAHLVLVDNPADNVNGDFNLEKNRLTLNQGQRLSYGNIGIYHPDLFKACVPGVFPLAPLLRKAVAMDQVTGEHFTGEWKNIGTVAALEALRQSNLTSSKNPL